jgi:energy-coupling factor transport system ATP-binding protein
MSIRIENLNHIYSPNTPFEVTALVDINLHVQTGEFLGLIGHTGSGKSTLIQELNALIKPTSGTIIIEGTTITDKGVKLRDVRRNVGLVFQYPEYQLFEETVKKDIAYGPKNLGLSEVEIEERVDEAMRLVGLDPEQVGERSPFDLSGGQRRRVAIAGVLAMKPRILILDEPTAGLDPHGRDEILGQIKALHQADKELTLILVSHSMEDVAKLVDRLVVLYQGKIEMQGTPREVFQQSERLREIGLGIPQVTELMERLRARGVKIDETVLTVEEAKTVLLRVMKEAKS